MTRPKTFLDDMIADLGVSRRDGSITILHDRPLDDELLEFQYSAHSGKLLFKFKNKEIFFGETFLGDFTPYFLKAKTITIMHMNMETKKPISGLEVPMSIIYH